MGKSTHFIGQPLYSQLIKLFNKSKILQISEDLGGERYTKRFNVWIHLIVMLYAVIKRFDSLRELEIGMKAEVHKLAHIGITFKIGRSTLADANRSRPEAVFEAIYRDLYARYRQRARDVYRNSVRYPHANPNAQLSITFRNSHGEIDEDVY